MTRDPADTGREPIAGDHEELFDLLIRDYTARVRRLMYRMVLDPADADDLTQEVFLTAWRKLHTFRGTAALSTWVYRIAVNRAISFLRRRRRAPFADQPLEDASEAARSDRPDTAVMSLELDRAITRALADLPPKLRSAIVLTAVEGLEPAAAAAVCGCPRATLYWRVHRARKLLEVALAAHL